MTYPSLPSWWYACTSVFSLLIDFRAETTCKKEQEKMSTHWPWPSSEQVILAAAEHALEPQKKDCKMSPGRAYGRHKGSLLGIQYPGTCPESYVWQLWCHQTHLPSLDPACFLCRDQATIYLIDMPAPELLLTRSDCSSKPGESSKINLNVWPGEAHFDHLLFCSSFFDVDWRMGKIRQRTSCNSMTDEEDIGWPGCKND